MMWINILRLVIHRGFTKLLKGTYSHRNTDKKKKKLLGVYEHMKFIFIYTKINYNFLKINHEGREGEFFLINMITNSFERGQDQVKDSI